MARSKTTDKPDDTQVDDTVLPEDNAEAEANDVTAEVEEASEKPDGPEDVPQDEAVELENPEEEALTQDPEDAAAETEEAPQPEPEAQQKHRSGATPMILGGVVAAAIGFGAASYLGSQGILFGQQSSEQIAELTRKLEDQQDLLKLLQSNQDKIAETANQANAGVAGVDEANARLAALSERLEALGTKTQTLEGRIVEAEKRPMTEGASSAAIEAYEREVEQLRAMVADQLKEAESLKQTSARTAQETMAQAALTRVVSAVDSGAPYRRALTELASVSGVAIPAALSQHADDGVPTNIALVEAFPDYARAALADARKQEGDGGNRISHFLKSQLGARSTEPKEGADADAVLSRAEAALREGRLAAALDEVSMLPETSQALMADWRAMAETRLAATQAVEQLAQGLNSN
ncbi:hypothetical protein [Shimia sediminis]|uniref:hypothetical protein n=1 Tax=Shimia sediminis TaxID=2497945 RepID=UPI000F8D1DF9|nr:hypothetical protein [Shimia sediminis]